MFSKPTIRPVGIGDLKVIRQKLVRYEAGEVAHIENVMAGENRSRDHLRVREFEETFTLEEERAEESQRDLQSTERFELQSEIEKTVKSESSLEAGTDISAGYGPVQVSARLGFQTHDSREESDKQASRYAKEITERTLSKLTERRQEERVTRTLERFEEKNHHGFTNLNGTNASGIYRWVDKYYRAKVHNYGQRLMYEFFVPEPASFYLFAKIHHHQNSIIPEKPEPPTVRVPPPPTHPPRPGPTRTLTRTLAPGLINRHNYLTLVQNYDVEGVEPPPPSQTIVSTTISRHFPSPLEWWSLVNDELEIPKGYEASEFYRIMWLNPIQPETDDSPELASALTMRTSSELAYVIGGSYDQIRFTESGGTVAQRSEMPDSVVDYKGVTGNLSFGICGRGYQSFVAEISVICRLTVEAFQKWQLATYNAIMNAYRKAVMDYEEKVAALEIQRGGAFGGNNPELNRETERQELKKACITLWTTHTYDDQPGIIHTPNSDIPANYPEINQANMQANAEQMAFVEEVFEWRNMTYEFLPYYWGRKAAWIDLLAMESEDPVFEQFLRAGAARVLIPVKPVYAEAVLYYQLTGEIREYDDVPLLSDVDDPDTELYNKFLLELGPVSEEEELEIEREVEISPDDKDAWMMKVPTTLIWLQSDTDLPNLESTEA